MPITDSSALFLLPSPNFSSSSLGIAQDFRPGGGGIQTDISMAVYSSLSLPAKAFCLCWVQDKYGF